MALQLGIDTGGTYTDAALLDGDRRVVASAKALTTREDLSLGLRSAAEQVVGGRGAEVGLVSISTTLATNAIVEGHGAPVCLLLIGQDPRALDRSGLGQALGSDPVVFIAGAHSAAGEARAALDVEAVDRAVRQYADHVSAFAIAAEFAVRNPAHEREARDRVAALCELPVTCSHELSADLDAPRRALTALLNARLVHLIAELIDAVARIMVDLGIGAPLMVVKGDGSLVSAATARSRPVETVLSGPAASVVGARHLAGEGTLLVVDMGGTTSDIVVLRDGPLPLRADGALVGGWRTMVEAVAAQTLGLGGDSALDFAPGGRMLLGPRRAVPFSLLADQRPELAAQLAARAGHRLLSTDDVRLALRVRGRDASLGTLTRLEQGLWDALADGPVWVTDLAQDRVLLGCLDRLVRRGLVGLAAFTPSDAAHVLGLHHAWSRRGAELAAGLWRSVAACYGVETTDETDFCERILEQLAARAASGLANAALRDEGVRIADDDPLLARALNGAPAGNLLTVHAALSCPLVAVGAPAATHFPRVAARLGARLVLPEHAEVANAVGAVASNVVQRARVLITQPAEGELRVHADDGVTDYHDLERALVHAREGGASLARRRALEAGAAAITVEIGQQDQRVVVDGHEIFIDSRITATAIGRPEVVAGTVAHNAELSTQT